MNRTELLDVIFDRPGPEPVTLSRRKRLLTVAGAYTGLFLITFLIAYSPFLERGTTFIWKNDGRTQHYPFFLLLGRTIRRTVINFLHGDFTIPLFDLSANLGDDLIGLLNVHGATDPLMLLSGLVLTKYSESAYGFLAIVRLYLAGLSFIFLCKYYGKKNIHTLIGSVIYAFCGYGMYCSMRHPWFVDGMYLLPVLIVGADKVIKRGKPYTLIFAVFYSLLCGYYEFYMMTIMVLLFSAVRFFDIYHEKRWKEFFLTACRGAAAYAMGVCMAAVVFFPAAVEFLNAYRSGFNNFLAYNYSWKMIITRLMRLFIPSGSLAWTWPTVAAICTIAVVVMFFSRKRRTLKIMTLAALAVFCTDVGNFVMNGFQYPSERWAFGLNFVMAYAAVEMLPQLMAPGKREKAAGALFVAAVGYLVFFTVQGRTLNYASVGFCFLLLFLIIILVDVRLPEKRGTIQKLGLSAANIKSLICLVLVIVNVGVTGINWAAADQGNYSAQFKERGYELRRLETAPERDLEPYLLNDPDGRGDGVQFVRNTAAVWHIPAMTIFSSVANGKIVSYYAETESIGPYTQIDIPNTDQRRMLLELSSVKYFVASDGEKQYVPYGYEAIKTANSGNIIYENRYALPWGYTYDAAVTYDDLKQQNGLQKEETMLQAVALDEVPEGYEHGEPALESYAVPYTAEYKNCKREDGGLTAEQANAAVSLSYSLPAGTEGYLRFKGLDVSGTNAGIVTFQVKDGRISKTGTVLSPKNSWYAGKENFVVNLGYCAEERTQLTITFSHKGLYKFDDIELYALPMDNYPERVEALRAEPLEDCHWGTNSLTGTVDLSKDKILCVSVPYSKGWSATVDGEEVEILRGNYMFMCLPLTAGHHDIEFHYCSPGIKLGAVVSVVSLCVVAGMIMSDRKKRKAGRNNEI